jgi:hypothetical protein
MKAPKLVLLALLLFFFLPTAHAGKTNIMDSPTAQILGYGSYEVDFKIFDAGAVAPRLLFGIFNFLDIGVSWEVLELIGHNQADPAVPALQAKIQVFSGDFSFPSLAVGYDGQGYIHKSDARDRYFQEPRGLYIVLGKEVIAQGMFVNIGINSYTLSNGDIYGFINFLTPLASENFLFMAEIDNINYLPDTRINLGVRMILVDNLTVDFIVRDCWGSKDEALYPNDRILVLSYSGQF